MIQFRKYLLLVSAFLILGSTVFAQKKSKQKKSNSTESASVDSQIKVLTQEALFINAMQSKLLGNYNEAAFRFTAIIKENPSNHAAYFQLAQIYYSLNQLDKAESANKTALNLNPQDEWYYIFLGQIKADRGDITGAADVYRDLMQIKSDDIELYYDWAMLLEESNRLDEALKVYDLMEKKVGLQEEIFIQKIPLYNATNQNKKALEEVNRLIQADSGQFRYYGYLGDIYEQLGEHDKAISAYEKILKLDAGNILGFYSLAEMYAKKGDVLNQKKTLEQALRSKDISSEDKIRLILPTIQVQVTEDSSDANKKLIQDLLGILVEAHPKDVGVQGLIAESYYTFGEQEKALSFLKELVKDSSASKETNLQLLSVLSEMEKYDELYQYAQGGTLKFPEDPTFDFFSAFSATINKKYAEAKSAYQQGLKKEFTNEALRLQMLAGLGDVSSELKDFETADNSYEKALEIDPNNATILNNYAYYLSVRNIELERAERMSKKSNLLEENNAAFQDTYAWILYQKGTYSEALKWMERAMKSAADKPSGEMYDHHGDILFKLNRKSEALASWEKALELDVDNKEVADKISANR